MNQPTLLLFNAVLCFSIMGICICRLNAMGKTALVRVQFEYATYMTAAFVSMARPWWDENVGWASLMLESAILFGFISSTHAWRTVRTPAGPIDTAPEVVNSNHAALSELPEIKP